MIEYITIHVIYCLPLFILLSPYFLNVSQIDILKTYAYLMQFTKLLPHLSAEMYHTNTCIIVYASGHILSRIASHIE